MKTAAGVRCTLVAEVANTASSVGSNAKYMSTARCRAPLGAAICEAKCASAQQGANASRPAGIYEKERSTQGIFQSEAGAPG